jgi:hypothetical protein
MMPPSEHVHWLFATGFLLLGLFLLAEGIVGPDVWGRRRWRLYLWPGLTFALGILLWPVMVFFTNSTLHMLAHWVWAQAVMLAGAAQLGRVHGKLKSRVWDLTVPLALMVGGVAFIIHEQNSWLFSRSAFLHRAIGWTVIVGAIFPLLRVFKPRSRALGIGYAATILALSVLLFADRDVAPIFGHLSDLAGEPRR